MLEEKVPPAACVRDLMGREPTSENAQQDLRKLIGQLGTTAGKTARRTARRLLP